MATRSNLTWRTFGLSVVGLCLACTHAALAGPGTARAYAPTMVPSRPPSGPGAPSRGGVWRGIGGSSIATYTSQGGAGSGSVSTFTNKGSGARASSANVTTRVYGSGPALPVKRRTIAEQTRQIEASRDLRLVGAPEVAMEQPKERAKDVAPERARDPRVAAAPERARDPRVAAALRPVLAVGGSDRMRDPFR